MADQQERAGAEDLFTAANSAAANTAPHTVATAGLGVSAAGNGRHNGATPYVSALLDAAAGLGVSAAGNGARDGVGLVAAPAAGQRPAGVVSGDAVGRVVGLLDALVSGLRGLGGELLEERLGLVGRCEARLAAVKSEAVTELARRDGEARAADVLRNGLMQSRGDAKRDVQFAGRLAELPGTGRALAEGAITPQHAKMIADASGHTAVDETELLPSAANEPADVFARTLRDHVNDRSGDDLEERRRAQRAQRRVSLTKQSDGMYKLFGLFDPVAGNRIETALAAAARKLFAAEDPKNRATSAQRFADALELLVTRNGAGKAQGTNLLVIADYDTVAGQLRDARLADGTPVAAGELVELALEAKILPAIFDAKSQPLWLGREHRHANDAQRIALAARDRGCVGCGTTNNVCQPHHVIHWEHDGPTDIDNLCLLCGDCHQKQVHTNGAKVMQAPTGRFTLRHHERPPPPAGRNHTATGHPRRRSVGSGTGSAGNTINHPLRR